MTKVLNDKQIIEAVISEVNETYGSCVISQHIMSRMCNVDDYDTADQMIRNLENSSYESGCFGLCYWNQIQDKLTDIKWQLAVNECLQEMAYELDDSSIQIKRIEDTVIKSLDWTAMLIAGEMATALEHQELIRRVDQAKLVGEVA